MYCTAVWFYTILRGCAVLPGGDRTSDKKLFATFWHWQPIEENNNFEILMLVRIFTNGIAAFYQKLASSNTLK